MRYKCFSPFIASSGFLWHTYCSLGAKLSCIHLRQTFNQKKGRVSCTCMLLHRFSCYLRTLTFFACSLESFWLLWKLLGSMQLKCIFFQSNIDIKWIQAQFVFRPQLAQQTFVCVRSPFIICSSFSALSHSNVPAINSIYDSLAPSQRVLADGYKILFLLPLGPGSVWMIDLQKSPGKLK